MVAMYRHLNRCVALALALAAALLLQPALALQALQTPKGPVILTVSGKIGATNRGAVAEFDAAMIAALPQHSFTTWTPWYPGPVTFTGPLLRDLLEQVRASGSVLRAEALNDYRTDVPVDDALRHTVVLARQIDGRAIPVREKGPLFIVYPFDAEPGLKSSLYYGRSVWQLRSLRVE